MLEKAIKLFAAVGVAAGSIAAVLMEYKKITSFSDDVKRIPSAKNKSGENINPEVIEQ